MQRKLASVCAAAAAVVTASLSSSAPADTLYWQGGNLPITDSNFTLDGPTVIDGNDNRAATAADLVRFGATGTGTLNGASASFGTLWVGHNEAILPSTTNASAVTVNNGAALSLTLGAGGSASAGLIVGHTRGGTLNIDGATTSVTSNQLVVIGFASNQPNRNGTINITNGATLNVTAGNINMGDSSTGGQVGIQGHLNVDGNVNVLGSGADINLGVRKTTCTVTQTGGLIQVADQIQVGFDGNNIDPASANSTYTITGGTTTTGVTGTGNFWIGRSASTGATLNLSGTGTLNVGNRLLMGSDTATGVKVVHQAGTMTVDLDLRIADTFTSPTSDATYNLSGTGVINALGTAKTIVGRRGTGKFLQTGGTVSLGGTLSIGDQEATAAATAADGLYKISAGGLTAAGLSIGTDGKGEFRVVGDDGLIDINGNFANGNTLDGLGTLAFELEAGDPGLSLIDVSGTATFASGSALTLDFASNTPAATSFDLLTAADIIDNGISFTAPAGWALSIVSGGTGEILRVSQAPAGGTLYWDVDGATPGSGGPSPSGAWDGVAANFTTDAAGASAATSATTTAADDLVFAAGTDGTAAYTVSVGGTQAANSVQVARGDVTFDGTGTIASGTFDVAAGASATVNAAVAGGAAGTLTKTGAGTLTLGAANTHANGTTVDGGTLVVANADALGTGGLTVNNATAQAQPGLIKAVTVDTLALTGTGKVDLTDNDLVIKTSTLAAVTAQIVAGYNNGTWDGAGIMSSSAATDENADTALGFVDNGELGLTSFSGVTLTGPEILVKYTYYGDADLTGVVDTDDFQLFLAGYQDGTLARTWLYGDFDYNSVIDTDDFQVFLYGYQNQGGPLSALAEAVASAEGLGASDRAFMQAAIAAVPEPASLGVLALAGGGLLARRSRRHRRG